MKKGVVAVVGVVVLAGAAVAAVPALEQHAAEQIKGDIENSGIAKVDTVKVGLFDRRIELTDLKSTSSGGEIAVGRWQATGLAWPLGELLLGRTPLAGFSWGDPLQADRIELKDVHVVDRAANSSWTLDSLIIEDFDLARFDAKYDGRYPFQVRTARALGALAMRRLEERNLHMVMPGTGDTYGVASAVIDRYQGGRIAAVTVGNFEAAARDGKTPLFRVGEIKAMNLDWSRPIAGLGSNKWYPGATSGRVHVDSASASDFSGELLARYGVSLGSVSLETVHESDKVSHSRARVEGFVLSPPLRGLEGFQMRIALTSMGLKEVKLDLDCTGSEDRAKGELSLDRCGLVGPGLGEIDLSGKIVHADPALWRAVDDGDVLALGESRAGLASARVVLIDRSLLERGLKALSTFTGQPVAVTRSNLARDIRRYQPTAVLISEDMTRLLDIVGHFVEEGGTLTIHARPERPIDLEQLQMLWKPGADLVQLFGLSASLSR